MLFNEEGKQEAVMILAGAEVTDEVFYFNTDGSFTLEEHSTRGFYSLYSRLDLQRV